MGTVAETVCGRDGAVVALRLRTGLFSKTLLDVPVTAVVSVDRRRGRIELAERVRLSVERLGVSPDGGRDT